MEGRRISSIFVSASGGVCPVTVEDSNVQGVFCGSLVCKKANDPEGGGEFRRSSTETGKKVGPRLQEISAWSCLATALQNKSTF